MKYLRIYNIDIHIHFYLNRFINECVKKEIICKSKKVRWEEIKRVRSNLEYFKEVIKKEQDKY